MKKDQQAVALVQMVLGRKDVCRFIEAADLGVTGVGESQHYWIRYKPGEEVDVERVSGVMEDMQRQMAAKGEHVLLSFEVLNISIEEVKEDE